MDKTTQQYQFKLEHTFDNSEDESVVLKRMYEQFLPKILNHNFPEYTDEFRPSHANYYGGIDYLDAEGTRNIRSIGWDIIKQIGRKLISGDFNLTTISFPIRVMIPLSFLQTMARAYFNYPIFLRFASLSSDPVEKMKYTITAVFSCFHKSSHFLKPLNPILGETYELVYEDGSKVYCEQTHHHPPVSHFYMVGPNNTYKYYGYSNFHSGAGLNSMTLTNTGNRSVEFPDGTIIDFDYGKELYSNTFYGTLKLETLGEFHFTDKKNGLSCTAKFGGVKGKASDFFEGNIERNGETVCKAYGSWLSYIEFDGKRYWDVRENVDIKQYEVEPQLKSSPLYRKDRVLLEERKLEEAQAAKEELEVIQRTDRKLREKYSSGSGH